MNEFQILVQKSGDKTIVVPEGSITWQNIENLKQRMEELIETGSLLIELNLKSVAYIDSEALELMVDFQKRLHSVSGGLILTELNQDCRDILIATRLISDFKILSKKGHYRDRL